MKFATLYFSLDGKISDEYNVGNNAPIKIYSLQTLPPFVPLQRNDTLNIFRARNTAEFTVNGEKTVLENGDIIVIKPFSLYVLSNCKNISCDVVSINLSECAKYNSSITRFIHFFADGSYRPITIRKSDGCYERLNECVENVTKADNSFAALENLLRLLYDNRGNAKFGLTDNKRAYCVAQIVETVSTVTECPKVSEIARNCGYSEFYTMKLFKKFTGESIVDYYNKYRITLAKLMLEKTDLDICEIARNTGFENVSYFNRQFKALFGKTPKQCRKDTQ